MAYVKGTVINQIPYQPGICATYVDGEQQSLVHILISSAVPGTLVRLADYVNHLTAPALVVRVEVADHVQVILRDEWQPSSMLGTPSWSVHYTIGANAHVTIQQYQRWPTTLSGIIRTTIACKSDSATEYYGVMRGGASMEYDMQLLLEERASSAHVSLVIIVNGDQKAMITSMQRHTNAHTASTFLVRGLVKDQAYISCIGTVHLAEPASAANAAQKSAFLLDGVGARAFAKPILEALNNEVSCTHGSAVGSLDEEQMTYCRLRGMHEHEARTLLTRSFLTELCADQVTQSVISDQLQKLFS